MKITFILPTVNMGGGIRVTAIYANALVNMGHDVLMISPPPRLLSFKKKIKSFIKGNGWPIIKSPKSHLDGMNIKHKILDKFRPVIDDDVPDADIIIATWWETAEWVMNLSDAKGAKVYFIQGHEVYPYLPVDRCKITYMMPMHKIVIAKWLRKIMADEYGDTQVDLVSNSVDHKQFFAPIRNKQHAPTVGFLYSISSSKGVDVTLDVIKVLRRRFQDLHVIAFGVSDPCIENNEFSNVEYIRSPKQEDIRNIYSRCDVWLTSSRIEGFNLPAMEAMACRTPIVSTKAGWPEEVIINGKNGMLTDVDDVQALATGVSDILTYDNDEWKLMSENAYQTVASSSWETSSKEFEESLLNACKRSGNHEIKGVCSIKL